MELVPIFFGGLFFLVCAGVGLWHILFKRGPIRWRGLLIAAIGLVGLVPLLMVAPPPVISLSSLSGTYAGTFGGGEQQFVLHPNGAYEQRFTADGGKVTNNRGTWALDTIQPGSLDFEHLLITWDGFGQPQKAEVGNFGGASVRLVGGGIYFNDDADICIRRVK